MEASIPVDASVYLDTFACELFGRIALAMVSCVTHFKRVLSMSHEQIEVGSSLPQTISIESTTRSAHLFGMIADEEYGAFESRHDMAAQGMVLLDWAVTEFQAGKLIVAVFPETSGHNEFSAPFMLKALGLPVITPWGPPSPPYTVSYLASKDGVALLDKLASRELGLFDSRADVLAQMVGMVGWASQMVISGAYIASFDRKARQVDRKRMAFIERLEAEAK